ncbi:MAG: hypothetical protein K9I85_10585 [Saprospiraceae bacterium]|nr:hypothetical protein [Saprospiraceae bacterium]
MKQFALIFFLVGMLTNPIEGRAPTNPSLGILDISVAGLNYDPSQAANIVRAELTKLDRYTIFNREDIRFELDRQGMTISDCYAKACLVEVGKAISVRKMFSGSLDAIDGQILVSFRVIDVGSGQEELTFVQEYLNLPDQIHLIIQYAIKEMYGQPVDDAVFQRLTQKNNFENSINLPQTTRLNLSGPRMGVAVFAGQLGKTLQSNDEGGFNASNIMFQFGYQFEWTYLNEGNFQALFEFVPLITGFDQGKFFPSVSLLNGLRESRHGWEMALGPLFSLTKEATGYINELDEFVVNKPVPEGFKKTTRVDSRGDYTIKSAFILSVGKSFRSGNLNLPINVFYIPGKEGNHRFGISVGYNTKR